MTATRTAAGQASERLTRRLIDLARQGIRPRCGDGEISWMFLDEDEHTRKIASTYCTNCVVLTECYEVGRYSSFGIYGGIDTTRRAGKKLQRSEEPETVAKKWRGPQTARDPLLTAASHRRNKTHWRRLRLPCSICGQPIDYDVPPTSTEGRTPER